MATIEIRVEKARGCGYRQPGGKYLVSDGVWASCGRLPIECDVCPTCHRGIHPSRGWTWIDLPAFLGFDKVLEQPSFCEPCETVPEQRIICRQCVLNGTVARAGLLWIGEKFYATPADFLNEAHEMGVSRRISAVPVDFKLGETWVLFAHRKAIAKRCKQCGEATAHKCERCEGTGVIYEAGIFHAFKPTRIEYVVKGDETEEELDRMEKQGLTLVRVIRDEDAKLFTLEEPDHKKVRLGTKTVWRVEFFKTGRKGVASIITKDFAEYDPAKCWEWFESTGRKRTVRTMLKAEEIQEPVYEEVNEDPERRCVICEDNDHPATVVSAECSDYCQEVAERNPEEEDA